MVLIFLLLNHRHEGSEKLFLFVSGPIFREFHGKLQRTLSKVLILLSLLLAWQDVNLGQDLSRSRQNLLKSALVGDVDSVAFVDIGQCEGRDVEGGRHSVANFAQLNRVKWLAKFLLIALEAEEDLVDPVDVDLTAGENLDA